MTSVDQAREVLYQAFQDGWEAETAMPLSKTAFENEEFDPESFDESARLVVRMLDAAQETLGGPGSRKFQRFASLFVDVWTPANSGMARAGVLAQAALTLFEGKTFSDGNGEPVFTLDATPTELGVDGSKHRTQVEVAVQFFETK